MAALVRADWIVFQMMRNECDESEIRTETHGGVGLAFGLGQLVEEDAEVPRSMMKE